MNRLKKLLKDRIGATAIEYGLIASLISTALILGLTPLGSAIKTTFTTVANALQSGN